jgi:hypothetical protein
MPFLSTGKTHSLQQQHIWSRFQKHCALHYNHEKYTDWSHLPVNIRMRTDKGSMHLGSLLSIFSDLSCCVVTHRTTVQRVHLNIVYRSLLTSFLPSDIRRGSRIILLGWTKKILAFLPIIWNEKEDTLDYWGEPRQRVTHRAEEARARGGVQAKQQPGDGDNIVFDKRLGKQTKTNRRIVMERKLCQRVFLCTVI